MKTDLYRLEGAALKEAGKALKREGANFPCPLCGSPFKMKQGSNICPRCGKTVEATITVKFK